MHPILIFNVQMFMLIFPSISQNNFYFQIKILLHRQAQNELLSVKIRRQLETHSSRGTRVPSRQTSSAQRQRSLHKAAAAARGNT